MTGRKLISFGWVLILSLPLSAAPQNKPDRLQVYHHESYPPLEFLNSQHQSDGFDVQVFQAVAKAAGLHYTLSGISWDSILTTIQTGEFDVLTGIYYRASEKSKLGFSLPFLEITYALFVPVGSEIRDLHDNISKRVAIVAGGVSSKLVDDFYAIHEVKQVNNFKEAIKLLQTGAVDGAVLPSLQAQYYLKTAHIRNIVRIGPDLLTRNLSFAVPAGDTLLLSTIDAGLRKIQTTGEYAALRHIWIDPYTEKIFLWRAVRKYLLGLAILVVAGIIGTIMWTTSLKQAVKSRTRELHREVQQRKHIADRLTESRDLKSLLFDIITHDLKNPAAVISGMADLMLKNSPKDEMATVVKQGSTNLLGVIENATTLSNIDLGEHIQKEPLHLKRMLEKIAHEFDPALKQAGMTLEIRPMPDIVIMANPIVAEIFKNFISNAIKYASPGGRILITAVAEKKSVTISVADFGETIPLDMRQRIFERSFQLEKNTRRGRGLGLAIVKRIAEVHQGQAGVIPNSPTGNIFYFTLPI